MASRLIISQLIAGDVIPAGNDAVIVAVLGIVAVISILIMISAKSKALGGLFVVIAGLSFGPLFPTVVGYTFNHTSPEVYGSAFGIIFAVGLLGGTTIPSAIGSMAKGKSIQKSLFIDMIAAIVLVAIAIIMRVVG
jgi:fucose permease